MDILQRRLCPAASPAMPRLAINLAGDHHHQVVGRGMLEVARGPGKQSIAECVEDETALSPGGP